MKTTRHQRGILAAAALFAAAALPAMAQITIASSVMGFGATSSSGGGMTLRGTVGQTVIGPATAGSTKALQGFWYQLPAPEAVPSAVPDESISGSASMRLQSYPNPFSTETDLRLDLPNSGFVSIKLYDALGREVRTLMEQEQEAEIIHIKINAADLQSGRYAVWATMNGNSNVLTIIVVK